MTIRPFLHLPDAPANFSNLTDVATYFRRMRDALFRMRQGKLECVTEITLVEDEATTDLVDMRLTKQSVVIFDPLTATAATELYGGSMYVLDADRSSGTWTISHTDSPDDTRSFRVAIIG